MFQYSSKKNNRYTVIYIHEATYENPVLKLHLPSVVRINIYSRLF